MSAPDSAAALAKRLESCKTLVWNGPLGCFELPPFEAGTFTVLRAAADADQVGSSCCRWPAAATPSRRSPRPAWSSDFSYVSSAGGAFLEWLEGKTLPGVAALEDRSER